MPSERIALVIGNAAYQHATALGTPVRDALAVAEALERLGFDVNVAEDCDISDFQIELDRFSERIEGAGAALFYYSGHGLQYGGDNYLIPVDARLQAATGLDRLTFQLAPLLETMRSKAGVSLVFLDACRDNPFEFDARESARGTKRVVVKPSGLTEIPKAALKDALIAFAAEQGKTADDGEEGGLSPFTRALCDHIEEPGLSVTRMMQLVKKSVRESTEGRQIPWSNDSLTNEFYFKQGDTEPPDDVDRSGSTTLKERRKIESQPPGPDPAKQAKPSISARLPNLAAGIEGAARNFGPVLLGGGSMMVAFLLLFISQTLDLASINLPENGKQVGFMAAPNWLVVYTILFPFYLSLFAVLTDRVRIVLMRLVQQKGILGPDGHAVSKERVLAAWRDTLQKFSLLLWCMLVIIVLQTGVEWLTTCLMPYFGGKVIAIDWTTSAIHGSEVERTSSIVFSGVAYLYMAFALYVYLAILVYAATVCYFLYTLADPTNEFRLVLRDATLGDQLSDIGITIYWSTILGLGAGFMMRLQAIYLSSDHLIVTDLLFNDILTWLGRPPSVSTSAIGGRIPSAWTGAVEMIFTLLILFSCCLFLYNTFERAKQYYLENIDSPEWREVMGINHSREQIDEIRRQSFLKTVFPMYLHFGIIVAGVVACGIFIGYGVIALATLVYVFAALIILPGLRRDHLSTAG